MKIKLFFAFITMLFFSACANIRYDNLDLSLDYSGTKTVSVAVLDHRPYVLSGTKLPSFVGVFRDLFGIPSTTNTGTGNPLSSDLAKTISSSLSNKGFRTSIVETTPQMSKNEVLSKLKSNDTNRSILLEVRDWKSSTVTNSELMYDVTLYVLNASGGIRTSKTMSAKVAVQGGFWCPELSANKYLPIKAREILEDLLNTRNIASAL